MTTHTGGGDYVTRGFERRFGCAPAAVARVPGRVNLLGEHIDYEGYDVLPAALAQCVVVAARVCSSSSGSTSKVTIANCDAETYDAVAEEVTLLSDDASSPLLPWRQETTSRTAWANYALCGILGILEHQSRAGGNRQMTPVLVVEMLVGGEIPAGCGLSSSSALVVAAALAFAHAADPLTVPSRAELAELCRRAEQRVGTMGGGMDQTVVCLAREGAALHISFAAQPPTVVPVTLPVARLGVTFVVANSLVVAQKAVDAATRFNKRVVECALAAKMIARQCGLARWREMSTLMQVHHALETLRGRSVDFAELLELAEANCLHDAYTRENLELFFDVALDELFSDSPAAQHVVAAATSYRLRQRAQHVWSEAGRVCEFCRACEEADSTAEQLGKLMLESHRSLQHRYECSCPELDALVECAMEAGAVGVRLTGAGWGGCIVALVAKASLADFMKRLELSYYSKRQISVDSTVVFEVVPSSGADVFSVNEGTGELRDTSW